ncbi:MAG TPA: phosphoribosyl-ATP diphosphatase [Gammaproteobacteria bacterium]|nr:phosphoribosyl-ATP diphosphatase [Gammaproteobacteria bacterium]
MSGTDFLDALEKIVAQRLAEAPESSYTARLAAKGVAKVAQKVGEEGVEIALAAVGEPDARVTEEAADLLYHLIVLLKLRGLGLADVARELERRHAARAQP